MYESLRFVGKTFSDEDYEDNTVDYVPDVLKEALQCRN